MSNIPDDKALLLEAHAILERSYSNNADSRTRALLEAIEAKFPRQDEILHLLPGDGTTRCGIEVAATLPRPAGCQGVTDCTCEPCLVAGIAELRRRRDMLNELIVKGGQQLQRLQLRSVGARDEETGSRFD